MEKAGWLKGLMVVFAVIFGFYGMQEEAWGQDWNLKSKVDHKGIGKVGKHGGQCVDYVKKVRPEVAPIKWGDGTKNGKKVTEDRVTAAKKAGFEVNDISRVGTAFI